MIKKLATIGAAGAIFAASALPTFASGPAAGTLPYPWRACPDGNNLTCAFYLGNDLIHNNGVFDCIAPNGKAGIGMLNFDSGRAHCFAQ